MIDNVILKIAASMFIGIVIIFISGLAGAITNNTAVAWVISTAFAVMFVTVLIFTSM